MSTDRTSIAPRKCCMWARGVKATVYKIDDPKIDGVGLRMQGHNECKCLSEFDLDLYGCTEFYRAHKGDCKGAMPDLSSWGVGTTNPDESAPPWEGGIGYTCEWEEKAQRSVLCYGCPDEVCGEDTPGFICSCKDIEYPAGTDPKDMCLGGNFDFRICSFSGDPAYWESLGWTHMDFTEDDAWDTFNDKNFFCTPCEACPMPGA